MATESMVFLGKWTFFHTSDKMLALDGRTNTVCVEEGYPDQSASNQRFNVYGDPFKKIWIQASNGKYLAFSGGAYKATETRTGSPTCFCLEGKSSGIFYLVDKGPKLSENYFVEAVDNRITRVPHNANPRTQFRTFAYANRVEDMQKSKEVPAKFGDLSHAYLVSADLSGISFIDANFAYADFSDAILKGTTFQGAKMIFTGVNLSNANLQLTRLAGFDLQGVNLSGANLKGADLTKANLKKAVLAGATLEGAMVVYAELAGAQLTDVDLTKTEFRHVGVRGASLKGANLSNKNLSSIDFDETTNFHSAKLQNVELSGRNLQKMVMTRADLSNANLDGVNLTGAELSFANLTNAKVRNNAVLYGASLSNAILKGANFTGAQLGAKMQVFALALDLAINLGNALDGETLPDEINTAFSNQGCPLSGEATLVRLNAENRWLITDANTRYEIACEGDTLAVWKYLNTSEAAVLAGAYMPDAIFTNANLYAVNMAGVNWYGSNANAENAHMEEVNLSHANIASMNFQKARMDGCSFDFASMVETSLRGTILRPSISKKPVSFVSANLQAADFTEAQLVNAVLTNAAISLNEGPFFKLDSSFGRELDNRNISQELRNQFTQRGYPLTDKAYVNVNSQNSAWRIINDGDATYPKYKLNRQSSNLIVFGDVIGVHLFDLPEKMTKDLDAHRLTDAIRTAFTEKGYTLLKEAKIDRVIFEGRKWHLLNEESNPKKLTSGYVEFYILRSGDSLHVYALALMVVRVGDDNKLQPYRYFLSDTLLTKEYMDDSTTCPNGQKLEMYKKHPDRLTWEMMMTGNTPPRPPKCIPSPRQFCPPE